ncbi:hypothetical protein, partial [Pseudomonas putida]
MRSASVVDGATQIKSKSKSKSRAKAKARSTARSTAILHAAETYIPSRSPRYIRGTLLTG